MTDFVKCNHTARCPRKARIGGKCDVHHRASGEDLSYVGADPVKDHIRQLQEIGWSNQRIAEAAGLAARQSVLYILDHDQVKPRTAQAIMSIPLDAEPRSGVVSAVGLRRRVQALATMGWTRKHIAEDAGISVFQVDRIADRRDMVLERNAIPLRESYERLCMTPGPSKYVKQRAIARGWLPPLSWDNIDDPKERPSRKYRRGAKGSLTPFEIKYRDLVLVGVTEDLELAERLDVSVKSLRSMRARAGLGVSA